MKSGGALTVTLCRNFKLFNVKICSLKMDYLHQLYSRLFGTNPENISTAITTTTNTNSNGSVNNTIPSATNLQ